MHTQAGESAPHRVGQGRQDERIGIQYEYVHSGTLRAAIVRFESAKGIMRARSSAMAICMSATANDQWSLVVHS